MRPIDADRLISILNAKADMALGEPKKYFAHVAQMVELLPDVDAVEVVRCKDCEFWKKQSDSAQGICLLGERCPTGAWYCANGRRREKDETD